MVQVPLPVILPALAVGRVMDLWMERGERGTDHPSIAVVDLQHPGR